MTDRQAAYSTHDFKWILKYASVYFAQVKDWHLHTIYNFKYPIAFKYVLQPRFANGFAYLAFKMCRTLS